MKMKVLAFAGSLRKDSLNKKFITNVIQYITKENLSETEALDLQPLNLPVYDGDIEAIGIPENVKKLADKIRSADALIISTPEYNGSISGVLKNAIDWVSRIKPNPFANKPVLLLAATPGALGGVRGLWHSRQPLEALGAIVFPGMHGLGNASDAFQEDLTFKDDKTRELVEALVRNYLGFVSKLAK